VNSHVREKPFSVLESLSTCQKMEIENTTTATSTNSFTTDATIVAEMMDATSNPEPIRKKVNAPRGPLAKHWAGCTWNNPPAGWKAIFARLSGHCTYWVAGAETGESGTPHIQFMLCFTSAKRSSTILKLFPSPVHLEVKSKDSTMKQASDYCKKDGQFVEYGTLPEDQHVKGLKVIKDNYADTLEKAKAGDFDAILPKHQIVHYKTIRQIRHDTKPMPADLTWSEGNQPNTWIHGPTRVGKSWMAREMLKPKFYTKNATNKWWDRYDGEENVLIEDIDPSHGYQGHYLKIWADKYAFPVEIKCSGDLIRPKQIVVTSNYSIEEVFPDPSIHLPLMERFKVIHKKLPWNASINSHLSCKQPRPFEKMPIPMVSNRTRKFDMPLTKPPMFRQNANGDLVPWVDNQPKFGPVPSLTKKSRAVKPKIVLSDSEDANVSVSVDSEIISIDDSSSEEMPCEICAICNSRKCNPLKCNCECHGGFVESIDTSSEAESDSDETIRKRDFY